jgi:predicted RNA polymerase sigma factor
MQRRGVLQGGAGLRPPADRLEAALRRGRPGRYQVQAAIAGCHATAADAADTDTERRYLTHRLAQTTNRT